MMLVEKVLCLVNLTLFKLEAKFEAHLKSKLNNDQGLGYDQ